MNTLSLYSGNVYVKLSCILTYPRGYIASLYENMLYSLEDVKMMTILVYS